MKKMNKNKFAKFKNDMWISVLLSNFKTMYACPQYQRPKLSKYCAVIKLSQQYTYQEIGDLMGISRQRAEQLHKQAIGHLLKYFNQVL